MSGCRIPIELDLRALPARPVSLAVELDLPQVLAHVAGQEPGPLGALTGMLADGRRVPAQYLPAAPADGGEALLPGHVVLQLPADVAAQDGARVTLAVVQKKRPAAPEPQPFRVVCNQFAKDVEVLIDGLRFAMYAYNTTDPELPRPYFHPVIGPTGVPITQLGEIPGKKERHFHHTGLFLAHQSFTGGNNWQIGPEFSRMRHLAFESMVSGPVTGRFVERLEWLDHAGERAVFQEHRVVTVPAREQGARWIDVDTVITCGDMPATWKATPYHLLAIRVPDAMTVAKGGVITSSEGLTNGQTAGAPAHWLDFSGSLNEPCGVALFDHPKNPRHPPPWLNFENETIGSAITYKEPLEWMPGERHRFRYRAYLHRGDVKEGKVAEEYAAYAAAPVSRIGAPERVG